MSSPEAPPGTRLVSVFRTDDPGLLPLAEIALQQEGIEYATREAGNVDSMKWTLSEPPTTRPSVVEILVADPWAPAARDLLADLQNPAAVATAASPLDEASAATVVQFEDAATGIALGTVSEEQLQELTSHLEEDGAQTYFLSADTVEFLRQRHADAALVQVLSDALSGRDHLAIRWSVR